MFARLELKHHTHPLNEDDEEPLEGIENTVEVALIEMLFEFWKKLG